LININTLGLDKNLLHGLDISFKGHPVITYRLREQIDVDTIFESDDFVFEKDSSSGRSLLIGKISGLTIQGQSNKNNQLPMTRWVVHFPVVGSVVNGSLANTTTTNWNQFIL
jgi:hypothetical protein